MKSSRARRRAVVIVGVMTLAMSLLATPASAVGSGPIFVRGTASLPNFPAPNGSGGAFAGQASGHLTGVGRTGPYSITYLSQPANASFTYNEPLVTCPATGTASGSFIVSGASIGTHNNFVLSGNFNWTRVGTSAAVTLSGVTLTLHGAVAETGGTGTLHGTFEAPNAVSNCLAGGGPLSATVILEGQVFFFPPAQ
jgi:hypothetical protein